jgi:hypothetical protein
MSSSTPVVERASRVSPAATPESLSLRLHARSPQELAHVSDLLAHFERATGLGWMRCRGDHETFHEIREFACGGVSTWCSGSASVSTVAADFEIEARPAIADRCSVCQRLHVQRRALEAGLDELVRCAP